MVTRKKPQARVGVTGRTLAYIQRVGKGKRLGKPETVMLTTVRIGVARKAPKRRRK